MSLAIVFGADAVSSLRTYGGQYAKPRSSDTETKDGVTLPCYRGDLIIEMSSLRMLAERTRGY